MKRIIALTALMLSLYTIATAQETKPTDVTIKVTPASQALDQLAKDQSSDNKAFQAKLQQARFNLDTSNKALSEQIQTLQKDLNEKLQADKKYKPMLDQIAELQKKQTSIGNDANAAFMKDTGNVQGKLKMETDQANGLIPVVRKENNLPDTATYSFDTQKWTVPALPKDEKK